MKSLKFARHLAEMILSGQKYCTWRIDDDKELRAGEVISLIRRPELAVFAQAKILWVKETTFASLTSEDYEGHETFDSSEEMYAAYEKYYGKTVGPETVVKVVRFELL